MRIHPKDRLDFMLLAPWRYRSGVIVTDLTEDECLVRIKAAAGWWMGVGGPRPVLAAQHRGGGKLRKQIGYGNPCQTILSYGFAPAETGARLNVRSGIGDTAHGLSMVWMGFAGMIWVVGSLGQIVRPQPDGWAFLIGPPLIALFMYLMISMGRGLARNEEAILLDFLLRTVEGRLVPR